MRRRVREGFDGLLGLVVLVVGAPQVNVDLRPVRVEPRYLLVGLDGLRVLATDRRADGVEVERLILRQRREVWDEAGGREHLVLRAVEEVHLHPSLCEPRVRERVLVV